MKIPFVFLTAIKVAAAGNLRRIVGTPESRDLQTIIDGTDSMDGRSTRSGMTLFIVENDNSRSTRTCAEDTADKFGRDFDDIFIGALDNDAKVSDIVAVIDSDTNCENLWADIERELHDSHNGSIVYVYYGTRSRYYRDKDGYRLNWGRRNRRSKKSSRDNNRRHKTSSRDKDHRDRWYRDRSGSDRDHKNNRYQHREREQERERDHHRDGGWHDNGGNNGKRGEDR